MTWPQIAAVVMRSRSASKLFECLCRPCIGKATLLRGNVGLELEALWTVDFVFILSLIFHHGLDG